MSERSVRRRIIAGACFLALAMVGLGTRLAFLHLGPNDEIRDGSTRRQRFERTLLAGRGNIFDRRNRRNLLAMNLSVKDVCVDPMAIVKAEQLENVSLSLSSHLSQPATEVAQCIFDRSDRRFAYVKRFVPEDRAAPIRNADLPGVFFRDVIVRYYPQQSFMCHVLGFVNLEGVGSGGVEQNVDSFLRGCPGLVEGEVDGRRREVYERRASFIPAIGGADVYLTLDQNVQYIVETALDDMMEETEATGAWAIVQLVKTGEILAMASRPGFDPNDFRNTAREALRNRALSTVYEPGSTFKAATIAAAIDEGTVSADTRIDCENGKWLHCNRYLNDHGGYSSLSVADGLKKSSNILAAKVALTLGRERFERRLRAFGIGRRLGIDLPGEEAGILHPYRSWSKISTSRIAIGQGVAVTALQMLQVFSTLANDGFLMRPYVTSHVLSPDGEILLKTEPRVIGRPVSGRTAATMRRLLQRVTEDGGTGTKARVDGWDVAGKTGTAQKPEAGGYSDTKYVASFVGFAPVSTPEIAVIVVVDEPKGERYYGGQVAAPTFSRIMGQSLRYLDVPTVECRLASSGAGL